MPNAHTETCVFACGDVMLGRGIDQILRDPCDPTLFESYIDDARDYVALAEQRSGSIPWHVPAEYPWGDALAILDALHPDVRVINLETSITRSDDRDRDKGIHYRVSPQNASTLEAARIDVCVLANNHVLDWGERGLLDTLDTLDHLHVKRCGAGRDLGEAMRPAVVELDSERRLAVFAIGSMDAGVPPWWEAGDGRPGVDVVTELDDATVKRIRGALAPWRDQRTTVVMSIHWGGNWGFGIPREHRWFAHELVDAGVHVVHGHSSHHVKGIEVYRGQPILYGCGDLLTDYEGIHGHEAFRGDLGLMYFIVLDQSHHLAKLELVPTRMHKLQLRRARAEDTRWLAATLARCGRDLGTSVVSDDAHLRLAW